MEVKKESPNNLAGRTGNKCTGKDTKRKRIKRYKLVSRWKIPYNVLSLERGLI